MIWSWAKRHPIKEHSQMRARLVVATTLLVVTAAWSPCDALQVTMSSPKASFVQGEPIYVWVDYYNETADEVGVAKRTN